MAQNQPKIDTSELFNVYENSQINSFTPALLNVGQVTGRKSLYKVIHEIHGLTLFVNDDYAHRNKDYLANEIKHKCIRILGILDSANKNQKLKIIHDEDLDSNYRFRHSTLRIKESFEDYLNSVDDSLIALNQVVKNIPAYNVQQLLLKKITVSLCQGKFKKAANDLRKFKDMTKSPDLFMKNITAFKIVKGRVVDVSLKDKYINPTPKKDRLEFTR